MGTGPLRTSGVPGGGPGATCSRWVPEDAFGGVAVGLFVFFVSVYIFWCFVLLLLLLLFFSSKPFWAVFKIYICMFTPIGFADTATPCFPTGATSGSSLFCTKSRPTGVVYLVRFFWTTPGFCVRCFCFFRFSNVSRCFFSIAFFVLCLAVSMFVCVFVFCSPSFR